MNAFSRLYTPAEVATIVRLKPAAVYSLLKSGKIKASRIGRSLRVSETELRRVLGGDEA